MLGCQIINVIKEFRIVDILYRNVNSTQRVPGNQGSARYLNGEIITLSECRAAFTDSKAQDSIANDDTIGLPDNLVSISV